MDQISEDQCGLVFPKLFLSVVIEVDPKTRLSACNGLEVATNGE